MAQAPGSLRPPLRRGVLGCGGPRTARPASPGRREPGEPPAGPGLAGAPCSGRPSASGLPGRDTMRRVVPVGRGASVLPCRSGPAGSPPAPRSGQERRGSGTGGCPGGEAALAGGSDPSPPYRQGCSYSAVTV